MCYTLLTRSDFRHNKDFSRHIPSRKGGKPWNRRKGNRRPITRVPKRHMPNKKLPSKERRSAQVQKAKSYLLTQEFWDDDLWWYEKYEDDDYDEDYASSEYSCVDDWVRGGYDRKESFDGVVSYKRLKEPGASEKLAAFRASSKTDLVTDYTCFVHLKLAQPAVEKVKLGYFSSMKCNGFFTFERCRSEDHIYGLQVRKFASAEDMDADCAPLAKSPIFVPLYEDQRFPRHPIETPDGSRLFVVYGVELLSIDTNNLDKWTVIVPIGLDPRLDWWPHDIVFVGQSALLAVGSTDDMSDPYYYIQRIHILALPPFDNAYASNATRSTVGAHLLATLPLSVGGFGEGLTSSPCGRWLAASPGIYCTGYRGCARPHLVMWDVHKFLAKRGGRRWLWTAAHWLCARRRASVDQYACDRETIGSLVKLPASLSRLVLEYLPCERLPVLADCEKKYCEGISGEIRDRERLKLHARIKRETLVE